MEPLMDCNLPELLAVDLKTPGRTSRPTSSVFKPPKSLTAGKNRTMTQSQVLDSTVTPDERELLSKMRSLELLDKKYSELLALGEELMKEVSDSELSGSDSSGYIEPPCIRTRNISVTTAATSVASARNRSGSAFNSASTSPQRKEPSRSWLDSDDGLSRAAYRSRTPAVLTPKGPVISPPRRSSKRYARTQNSFWSPAPTSELYTTDPFAGFGGSVDDSYDTVSALPSYSDAHETSASRMQSFGADRTILSSPRDRLVIQQRRTEGSPRSPPSPTSFVPSAYDTEDTPTKSYLSQSRNPRSRMASATQYRQPDDVLENLESQHGLSDTSASREDSFVTPRRDGVRPQSISIETWFQTVIDDFAHPFDTDLEAPTSRIPIPAEVLETLRVSVSCFPETMLLCSSLSIETIRSHVRKVKYEGKGCQELKSTAQISSILDEKPKASAWRKFTSMTRRTPAGDGAATRAIGSSSVASQHMTSFGLERDKPTWPNASLDWVSIKGVFPNGTDYLCDALYAHLLTYNYIDSLCPRAAASAASAPTPRPRTANDSADAASPRSSSSGQGNSKIPRKAASLLGLHNNSGDDGPVPPVPALPQGRQRGASVSSTMSRANTVDAGRNVLRGKKSHGSHGSQRPVWDESNPAIPRTPVTGKRRPLMGSIISTTPIQTPKKISLQRGTIVTTGNNHARTAETLPAVAASKLSSAEQSLLDLRAGLLTCITRLIITLQTTSSYGDDRNEEVSAIVSLADDGADDHYGVFYPGGGAGGCSKRYGRSSQNARGEKKSKDNAVDPFLMRSLCELVRVGESKGCQD